MTFIKFHAKTPDFSHKAIYINKDQITALNSAPQGTLIQVGPLAYMVQEDLARCLSLLHNMLGEGEKEPKNISNNT